MIILKGTLGKVKHELMASILNSSPYLIVQTLGVNRIITLQKLRQQLRETTSYFSKVVYSSQPHACNGL